ncbi:MAG: formyltransferase family protein, partial [Desulfomonilia bacterium]
FSFYYRYMLSTQILEIPQLGAYNLHGSYLPYYRGRCPVNWVIINGENSTGVTLHEMVEKPDAGPIVVQRPIEIALDDTPLSLFSKIEHAAELLLVDILPRIRAGDIRKTPQDLEKGSYFGGRKPEDGRIAWEQSARDIYNLIRGVTRPYPGAFSFLGSTKILFWWAEFDESCQCGKGKIETTDNAVIIGTGRGCILPREIEVNGRIFTEQTLVAYFKEHNGEFFQ